jgi:hypothetical protein
VPCPPPLTPKVEYSQFSDARYRDLPPEARPRAESLADVSARLLPYFYDAIVPDLRSGGYQIGGGGASGAGEGSGRDHAPGGISGRDLGA